MLMGTALLARGGPPPAQANSEQLPPVLGASWAWGVTRQAQNRLQGLWRFGCFY